MNESLKKVLYITVVWTLISLFKFLIGIAALIDMDSDFSTRAPEVALKGSLITGILAGLIGGSVITFFWERWLREKPYGWTLRSILISYIIIFYIISTVIGFYYNSNLLQLPVTDPLVWNESISFLSGPSTLVPMVFWLIVVISTLIVGPKT